MIRNATDQPILLLDLLDRYGPSDDARPKYEFSIQRFRWFVGHEPTVDDFAVDTADAFVKHCLAIGLAVSTVRDHQKRFSALWRFAAKRRLAPRVPELTKVVGTPGKKLIQQGNETPGTLQHYFHEVFEPKKMEGCKQGTLSQYRAALTKLGECSGGPVLLSMLNNKHIDLFVEWLRKATNLDETTIRNYRCCLEIILRDATGERGKAVSKRMARFTPDAKLGTLRYFLHSNYTVERSIAAGSVEQIEITLRLWGGVLGHDPAYKDLTDENVNAFIIWLEESGTRRPATIRKHAANLTSMWRYLWYSHKTKTQPGRIRKIRVPRVIPEAWTVEEIAKLTEAAKAMQGTFRNSGIRRAWFWESLIRAAWDTGLRRGDLLRLSRSQIPDGGCFRLVQEKTKNVVSCVLRPETLALIDEGIGDRDAIWGVYKDPHSIGKPFGQLVESAGIRPGTLKRIRKSAASYVEAANRGTAAEFLGHAPGSTVAPKHYLDRSITTPEPTLPPSLEVE